MLACVCLFSLDLGMGGLALSMRHRGRGGVHGETSASICATCIAIHTY
jgi:hypothetical protein